MKHVFLAAVVCVLCLVGCAAGRYELSRDEAGRLLRLDTLTGEVMLVEGDKLTPVKKCSTAAAEPTSKDEELPQVDLPAGGKSWPTLTMPKLGNTKAELTSYWYNGKMHFVIELYPLSKRLKLVYSGYYPNSSFSLLASDTTGKQILSTLIPANHLKHTLNKEQNVEQISAEGILSIPKEDYDSLTKWELRWNL